MATEIERKFKVLPEHLPVLKDGCSMKQGYLQEEPQIRFRSIKDKVIIGIKLFHPNGSRFELETEKRFPSEEEISVLCSLTKGRIVEKTRYTIPHEGLNWEIDVYEGENEGLITAEVELPDLEWNINFPSWIDQEGELTSDYRYANISLAQNPYCYWSC